MAFNPQTDNATNDLQGYIDYIKGQNTANGANQLIDNTQAGTILQAAQAKGYSPDQIAQMIGVPVSAVTDRIRSAFPNMGADYLNQYGYGSNTATPTATPTANPTINPTANNPAVGGLSGVPTYMPPGNPNPNNVATTYPTPIPQSPDYWGSAQAQGNENINAARATVSLSNPNFYNPYGSQVVSVGPDGRPTVTQSLSPDQQKRLDSLNSILPGLTSQISAITGKPYGFMVDQNIDSPSVGGVTTIADALRAREQPRFDRQRQSTEANLIARGFNPNDEAYKAAMDEMNRSQNDFNLGLIQQAGQEQSRLFDLQSQNRGRQVGEEQLLRTLPIQNYAQLTSAMQPNLPQFQQYTGAQVEAAPYFNATNAQGIFDLGRYQSMINGELGTRGIDQGASTANKSALGDIAGALFGFL